MLRSSPCTLQPAECRLVGDCLFVICVRTTIPATGEVFPCSRLEGSRVVVVVLVVLVVEPAEKHKATHQRPLRH